MATNRSRAGGQAQASSVIVAAATAATVKTHVEDVWESAAIQTSDNTFTGNNDFSNFRLSAGGELTIASGVITPTSNRHNVDTEADASTDDLVTITATDRDGQILVLSANNDGRTVVCKDGTGNLQLSGDFSLTHTNDRIMLICDGTNWYELTRSDNAT